MYYLVKILALQRERERERERDNKEDIVLWNKSIWKRDMKLERMVVENDYAGDDNDGDIVWHWW